MSLFPNAQGFNVNNSQFTAITNSNNTYLSGPPGITGIDILREASAPEAAHDSSARAYPPRCFPGTREQYIEDIVRRAIPSLDDPPPVYWMKGPAGVGKSAIAQTCSEKLKRMGALGAAFFFSISKQCKPEQFFPSIAYQLSTVHPAYRDMIDRKIFCDKTLVNKAMQFQFQYLIDEPLRELEQSGKGLRSVQVFVDGLDECDGTEAQCEIIRIVAASVCDGILPLRWAFFSRPEPHIEAMFSKPNISSRCYKAILPISRDADGEIELYLRAELEQIIQHRNPSTQLPWPSVKEMEIVVRAASGSFIYATTVVRFVGRKDSSSPQERLCAITDNILKRHSHVGDANTNAPFTELDAFYMLILQRLPTEAFPSIHLLFALCCRYFGGDSAIYAANTLGLSKEDFYAVCSQVSAVVHFEDPGRDLEFISTPESGCTSREATRKILCGFGRANFYRLGGRVEFYHKSFLDFLLDPARSDGYYARASEALTKHFVKVHLDYDRSYAWHGPDLVLAPGIPDPAVLLPYPCVNEFVNSCLATDVYDRAGCDDPYIFPALQDPRGLCADRDFRKWLCNYRINWGDSDATSSPLLWGCESRELMVRGVGLRGIGPHEFPKFSITKFKLMIQQREEASIIRQFYPTWTSRIASFYSKFQEDVESAFYCIGRGEKQIYWYWEINHKVGYYRDFRTIDLAAGEQIFREGDFDSWLQSGALGVIAGEQFY